MTDDLRVPTAISAAPTSSVCKRLHNHHTARIQEEKTASRLLESGLRPVGVSATPLLFFPPRPIAER